jgi:hypothetical protein
MKNPVASAATRYSSEAVAEAKHQATMLITTGVPIDEARAELIDNGVSRRLAEQTIEALVAERDAKWRSMSVGLMITGAALLAGGAALTGLTYLQSGEEGSYVMMTGMLAGGVSSLVVGIGMRARGPRTL